MTNQALRVGRWSALSLFVVGLLYAVVLSLGIATTGFHEPIGGAVLDIMEGLTLLAALVMVALFSAIHTTTAPEAKVFSLAAFGFAAIAAALTAAVHFAGLTALRELGRQGIQWPSEIYAVELLAWDVFVGLALLAAAPAFQSHEKLLRLAAIATGALSLIGAAGPLSGFMPLQFIGVLGYGVLLPVTSLLLANHFRSANTATSDQQ